MKTVWPALALLLLCATQQAEAAPAERLVRQLSLAGCGAGAGQRWVRHDSGNQARDYRIQLAGSATCVGLKGTEHEQTLTLAACTSGENDATQLWTDSVDPRAGPGFVCAASAATACDGSPSDLPCCLSAAGGSTTAGTALNTYRRCNNGPPCLNQQWRWANDSSQHLLLATDGLCVTAGPPQPPPPPGPPPGPPPPPPAATPLSPL